MTTVTVPVLVITDKPLANTIECDLLQPELRDAIGHQQSDSDCDSTHDSTQSQPSHTNTPTSTPGSCSPVGKNRCRFRPKFGFTESWILTPPPCFTLGGSTSSQMAMDPMENLLIEHPSMSVYNSHCSQGSTGEASDLSESSNDSLSQVIKRRNLRPRNSRGIVSHPPCQPQAVAARAGVLAQIDSVRGSQKLSHYKETRRLSRNNLNRMNHASDVSGSRFGRRNPLKAPRTCVMSYQKKH